MIRCKKVFQRLQTKCGALRHGWQHKEVHKEVSSKDAGSNQINTKHKTYVLLTFERGSFKNKQHVSLVLCVNLIADRNLHTVM